MPLFLPGSNITYHSTNAIPTVNDDGQRTQRGGVVYKKYMVKILNARNRVVMECMQDSAHAPANQKEMVRVFERQKSSYHEARRNTHNSLEDKINSFSIQRRAFKVCRRTNRGGERTSLFSCMRKKNMPSLANVSLTCSGVKALKVPCR
jgi:hypothetical protein